jgi:hypothetical protein
MGTTHFTFVDFMLPERIGQPSLRFTYTCTLTAGRPAMFSFHGKISLAQEVFQE